MQFKKEVIQKMIESNEDYLKQLMDYENLPNFRLLADPTEVIKNLLDDNGMETISIIDNMNDEFVYNSSEAVKSTIKVYAPNLRRLPESEKQILFEKLFEVFGLKQKKDKFVFSVRMISFIAQKPQESGLSKTSKSHL
ncbi:hypothetical protein ACKWTF_013239 [Chironomus riparius]